MVDIKIEKLVRHAIKEQLEQKTQIMRLRHLWTEGQVDRYRINWYSPDEKLVASDFVHCRIDKNGVKLTIKV